MSVRSEGKIEEETKEFIEGIEKCLRCRYCLTVCPLYDGWLTQAASGKMQSIYYLLKWGLKPDEHFRRMLFRCSTCKKCDVICKTQAGDVKPGEKTEKFREILNKKYGMQPLERQIAARDGIMKHNNPYHEPHENRFKWAADLPKSGKYLYFVGCTAAYRILEVARATVEIFRKLGVDFFVLNDEACCGSVLLRTGQTDDVVKVIGKNMDLFRKNGVKNIVTSCAGCYRTIKVDYPIFADSFNINVLHSSEVVKEHLPKYLSKLRKPKNQIVVTYHDPCHLGRHCDLYEAPRDVIKMLPNVKLVEMKTNRADATCCGAGGGLKSGFPQEALDVAKKRIKEAEETGAERLISACPFCQLNLVQAIKETGSKLKMQDLTEFVLEFLQ